MKVPFSPLSRPSIKAPLFRAQSKSNKAPHSLSSDRTQCIEALRLKHVLFAPHRTRQNFQDLLDRLPESDLRELAHQSHHDAERASPLFEQYLEQAFSNIQETAVRNECILLQAHPWLSQALLNLIMPIQQEPCTLTDTHLFSLLPNISQLNKSSIFLKTVIDPLLALLDYSIKMAPRQPIEDQDNVIKLLWLLAKSYNKTTGLKKAYLQRLERIKALPNIPNHSVTLAAKVFTAIALNDPALAKETIQNASSAQVQQLTQFIHHALAFCQAESQASEHLPTIHPPLILSTHLSWLATLLKKDRQETKKLIGALQLQVQSYAELLLSRWSNQARKTEVPSLTHPFDHLEPYYSLNEVTLSIINELNEPFRSRLNAPESTSHYLNPVVLPPTVYALLNQLAPKPDLNEDSLILQFLVPGEKGHPHTIRLTRTGNWLKIGFLDNELHLPSRQHIQATSYLNLDDPEARILFTKGRFEYKTNEQVITYAEGRTLTLQGIFDVLLGTRPNAQIRIIRKGEALEASTPQITTAQHYLTAQSAKFPERLQSIIPLIPRALDELITRTTFANRKVPHAEWLI